MRWFLVSMVMLALLAGGPFVVAAQRGLQLDARWFEASRAAAGLAPAAGEHPEALVQVYAARAFSWRGILGVHTWIAVKPAGAGGYRVLQVTRWSGGVSDRRTPTPDRAWFGNEPVVLAEVSGPPAAAAIEEIEAAVGRYPYAGAYRIWPGPNSNTFTAWVLRAVDGLAAELPATAIGKDYLGGDWVAPTPSATGYQFSLGGLLGASLARAEGLEISVGGLVLGLDPQDRAVKLPGVGRVGWGGGGVPVGGRLGTFMR